MAQFYENFNGATVGAGHPDFSVLWGDLGISVESTSIVAGSDAHLLLSHVTGTFNRNAVAWTKATTSGTTIVRALVEFQNHDTNSAGGISGAFLSGTGTDATRTGYVQWFRKSHAISRYDAGSDASAVETTEAFSTGEQGDVVQRYVEIIRDGSLIEVREWKLAEERPAAADLSFTDASPLPVSGAVGLSHLSSGTASSPNMRVYEVQVATDGDALPGGPTVPTLRKGSQFTVETTLAGSMTGTGAGATLNGNAITVDSHVGTTVTLTDSDGSIATSGTYDLVLTDDAAATETIVVQVNVVGLASDKLRKDGGILADLTDVEYIVMTGAAGSRAVNQNNTGRTSNASGDTQALEVTDTALNIGDSVLVIARSESEGGGTPFVTTLGAI